MASYFWTAGLIPANRVTVLMEGGMEALTGIPDPTRKGERILSRRVILPYY
jgi:hypothetical protein